IAEDARRRARSTGRRASRRQLYPRGVLRPESRSGAARKNAVRGNQRVAATVGTPDGAGTPGPIWFFRRRGAAEGGDPVRAATSTGGACHAHADTGESSRARRADEPSGRRDD